MADIEKVLKLIKNSGISYTIDNGNINVTGVNNPKILQLMKKYKKEIIQHSGKNQAILEAVSRGHDEYISSIKNKLRKAIQWFIQAETKLWDNGQPINIGSKLELMFSENMKKYIQLQELLFERYKYDKCIFISGRCPDTSPVKCYGCAQ